MKLHFGKYKGCDLADVPMDYLSWAVKNLGSLNPQVKQAIEYEILNRESELDILNTFYTQAAEDAGILGQERLWVDPYRELAIQMGLIPIT